jgi:hypothetical protein
MQRSAAIVTGLLSWGLVCACSTGPIEISTEPLSGVIGGANWTLASADTDAFLSARSDTFFATGYGEALTPCTGAGSASNGNRLILNIPKTAGDYVLSGSLNQTFYVPAGNTNYVSTEGRMIVEEVTATRIRASAHFRFDVANEVDGQFAVTICE